ncbi:MAG: hypothetical protein IJ795_05955 [Bacteroidales bacterium]|nr:hypothetical protein [Bacteroidales bacterium]
MKRMEHLKLTALLMLTSLLSFCSPIRTISSGSNPKPDGPASYYEYQYSVMMRYPQKYYMVERNAEGKTTLAWSENCEEDIRVILAPDDLLTRIDAIVSKYKLYRLKSSYRPSVTVLDGNMWGVQLRFDKNSIYSGGSNAWPPKKLSAGIAAINDLIEKQIESASEEDIIERRKHD